jgi:hypothetical protein
MNHSGSESSLTGKKEKKKPATQGFMNLKEAKLVKNNSKASVGSSKMRPIRRRQSIRAGDGQLV